MELDDLRLRLQKSKNCIDESFDSQKAKSRLEELLARFGSGDCQRQDVEEYGKIEHRLRTYLDLIERTEFIVAYSNEEIDEEETEILKEEAKEHLGYVMDFILQNRFTERLDSYGTIITIERGTVGQRDLNPFIRNLAKAYQKFAEKREFFVEEIDEEEKEISFIVKGNFAYGYFRGEHGVHKVIVEDEKGKRQTGYVSVKVEPLIENNGFTLREEDIKYEVLAAGTPGGSNANTGNTGIRLRHKATGITATSRRKSKNNNIKVAREVLVSRVAMYYKEQEEKFGEKRINPSKGNHFRTYSLTKGKYISDSKTGLKTSVEEFLKGNIEEFIYSFHGINFI